jgi:hypothetical protein
MLSRVGLKLADTAMRIGSPARKEVANNISRSAIVRIEKLREL